MLPKSRRLRKEKDIKRVSRLGQAYFSKGANLRVLINRKDLSRFAVIVSSRVAQKSTARNKIRRQLSEIIRKNWANIATGIDGLLIAREKIQECSYGQKQAIIINLLKKAKAWKKQI